MPGPVHVSDALVIPAGELGWRFSRSSGPGGQSVNTSDTRVELLFDVAGSPTLTDRQRERLLRRLGPRLVDGVLRVTAAEHRSQLANREAAQERLAAVLRGALAPPPRERRRTRVPRSVVERRLADKRRRSTLKRDRRPPE